MSEFLSRKAQVRRQPHAFKMLKRLAWPVCSGCGLMLLRNEATRKAAKALCEVYED